MTPSRALKSISATSLAAMALVPAGYAAASTSQFTVMQDDGQLIGVSPARRAVTLDEMKALGTDVVKVRIDWRALAPSPNKQKKPHGFSGQDPKEYRASRWYEYDAAVRGIVSRGMRPYLLIGGRAPNWASGKTAVDRPHPSELKRFAHALGVRYSGSYHPAASASGAPVSPVVVTAPLPRVTIWSVWNEPNLKSWLSPQYDHGRPVSPHLYRQLVTAVHASLSATGHGGDELLIGELLPYARSGEAGRLKVRPLEFLRELACVDSHYHAYTGSTAKKRGCAKFKPVPGTGLAYHPYSLPGGPDVGNPNPDDASIGELGRVLHVLNKLSNAHRLASHRVPIWITEFGYQTNPPDRYQTPIKEVPGFLGEAEWFAYRNPSVVSYSQYPLVDDPIDSRGSGFQSGLRNHKRKKKRAIYNAFRLPLFVQRRSPTVVEVFCGIRAGSPGQQITIESRLHGKFKPLPGGTVHLNAEGYFDRTFSISSAAGRKYRFRYAGGKSRTTGVHG